MHHAVDFWPHLAVDGTFAVARVGPDDEVEALGVDEAVLEDVCAQCCRPRLQPGRLHVRPLTASATQEAQRETFKDSKKIQNLGKLLHPKIPLQCKLASRDLTAARPCKFVRNDARASLGN